MVVFRIETLGSLLVYLDQERIAFDTDKTGALLVYLTTEANCEHQREHLAALLWSDLSQERARTACARRSPLRKAIREEKAATPFLDQHPQHHSMEPASDNWLDLRALSWASTAPTNTTSAATAGGGSTSAIRN